MSNSAGTPPLVGTPETDSRQLIAADLRSLIAQIDSSMRLINAALVQDDGDQAGSTDIFVLDDITPRYAAASAALSTCRAGLGHALRSLSEPGGPVEMTMGTANLPHQIA